MKMKKEFKVKIERIYHRGHQQNSSREIVGDLQYIQKYFGVDGKTIKSVLKSVNKNYDYRYGCSYTTCTASLVEG